MRVLKILIVIGEEIKENILRVDGSASEWRKGK